MGIYELYGRAVEENQRLLGEYANLLSLVERIKSGEVKAENVEIDSANSSWQIKVAEPAAVDTE